MILRMFIYIKNKNQSIIYCPFCLIILGHLLGSFNNSPCVEGPVFIREKLNKILIYSLTWIERHRTQRVSKRAKQVEVWRRKVRRVWWVWQHIPSEVHFLADNEMCVALRCRDATQLLFTIWTFLDDGLVQTVQFWIDCLFFLVESRKTRHL